MRALLALALLLSGCASTAAGGSRLAAAPPPPSPAMWRSAEGVGVGVEMLLETERQTARFGSAVELPPDVVPLLVVLGHAGTPNAEVIIARGSEIELELPGYGTVTPLEPVAVAGALAAGKPPAVPEPAGDRPKFSYEAPVTIGMFWLFKDDPRTLLLSLFYVPATLTIDTVWSVTKWGVRSARASHVTSALRDRNARLARLEEIRLAKDEWAAAILYFRVPDGARVALAGGSIRVPFRDPSGAAVTTATVALTAADTAPPASRHDTEEADE
ncbi:MAG: hypothetical protein HYU41_12970 [Candidatus Rokubacteria bacterium]|nr:hypothetical protein [Candidatus Rokubacteria bacterium]